MSMKLQLMITFSDPRAGQTDEGMDRNYPIHFEIQWGLDRDWLIHIELDRLCATLSR